MARPLEEDIDYHKLNAKASDALLAKLIEIHGAPEPAPAETKFAEIEAAVEPILAIPSARAAEKAWREFIEGLPRPKYPAVAEIKICVLRHFNIRKNDLESVRRTKDVVLPRQIAMYLAKQRTARSLPEIGRQFGGRDHTTVLHACRRIEHLIATDADVAAHVRAINDALGQIA